MIEMSCQELIRKLQGGDLSALGHLYDQHNRMVYRTALAITGDPEAAADLLQDVFLRLFRFSDRVDSSRPLEPWLYRMTANLACTWVRRQRWMRPIEDLTDWLAGDARHSPSQAAESAETSGAISRALNTLKLNQRTVVVMYYINELSLQEISEVLDVPVGTVKSRLHYGRQALKKAMSAEHGVLSEMRYEFT